VTATTALRPRTGPCPRCMAPPDDQRLIRGPRGPQWRCVRCNAGTDPVLPWPATAPADGREQAHLALETLAIFVPAFAGVPRNRLYEITRLHFAAGWCVRDLLHAMDRQPDGSNWTGPGSAWVRGEGPDITLARLRRRLRQWRWDDEDDRDSDDYHGPDVMAGPWRAEADAREQATAAARERHAAAVAARPVLRPPDPAVVEEARRAAQVAAGEARRRRSEGEAAEREALAAEIERGRAWSARQQGQG
jgi:hypothetical protein